MLKKQFVFILITLMLLTFVACNMLPGDDSSSGGTTAATTSSETTTGDPNASDEPPAVIMTYENVTAGYDTVSFSIRWAEGFESTTLTSLSIWDGEVKVTDLAANATAASGLLSNHSYRIVATYQNGGAEETEEYAFTTLAKTVPSVTLQGKTMDYTACSFELTLTDPTSIAEIKKIELWKAGVLVQSLSDLSKRSFEGLYSGTAYEIRVTFEYDLNEGDGVQTGTRTLTCSTKTKTTPTLSVGSITSNPYALAFKINLNDRDGVFTLVDVTLTNAGTDVPIENVLGNHSITGLIPNETYTLTVSYTYDLGDGNGATSRTFTYDLKTSNMVTINGITYELSKQGAQKLAKVKTADASLTEITEFVCVDGYTVTEIADNAFSACVNLTNVVLPDSLQVIGVRAFYNCSSLTKIILPSSVTTVKENAIRASTSVYAGAATKPSGWVSSWHSNASVGETWNVKELYTDAQGVTYILRNDNTAVVHAYTGTAATVTLGVSGYTVTEIASEVFRTHQELTAIMIPASVQTIGSRAIPYDTVVYAGAESQPIGWDSRWHEECAENVIWNVKDLYTSEHGVTYVLFHDNTASVISYRGTATDIILGVDDYTIVSIKEGVFANCDLLTKIEFAGTMAEWSEVETGDSWNQGLSYEFFVQCSNGSIFIHDNEEGWQDFVQM